MKKILAILAILLIPALAFAANSVTDSGSVVSIKNIDSDFTYTESCLLYGIDGNGARINFIKLVDRDLDTYVKIKEGSDSGAVLFYNAPCSSEPLYYHGARLRPVLDFSDSSVGHDTTEIIFHLWPQ